MKKLILLLLITISLFTACSSDDDNTSNVSTQWSVIGFSGGLMGVNQSYDLGAIVWNFNSTTLQIVYNYTPNPNDVGPYPGPGTYQYEWINENGNTYLYIDGVSYGKVSYDGVLMFLDDNPGADGFFYTLEKL